MQRARRFCSASPRCGNLTDGGACPSCRRKRDRARGTAQERGYDAEWARYSHGWLALHRWCGERADFRLHAEDSQCVQRGLRTRATVTDHRRSMAMGGAKFDPANHQSLCADCNRRKAIRLEGALARPPV
jgi:5-methylcytosine-specific restriction enzyme A